MKLNKSTQLNNPTSSTNSKNPKNFVPLIIVSSLLIFVLASPAISQAFDFDGQLKGITITDPDSGNAPPNAVITHTTVSETPFQVNFDAGGSTDSDGSITEYRWDFGDGTTGTGAAVSHEFTTEGAFPVTLTVVDDMGGVALSQVEIASIYQFDIIIDNGEAGTTANGTWLKSGSTTFYGSDSLYSKTVGDTYMFESDALKGSPVTVFVTFGPVTNI